MSWSLRLIERIESEDGRSLDVVDIGEIAAPTELSMLGIAKAGPQTEIVGLQEAALAEAARRSPLPIGDHRRRVLQTLFGAAALRAPRLRPG